VTGKTHEFEIPSEKEYSIASNCFYYTGNIQYVTVKHYSLLIVVRFEIIIKIMK